MNAETETASARFALRNALMPLHERVEAGFAGLDLKARHDYRLFLQVNAAALVPLELLAEQHGVTDVLPDWTQRTRRHAILADLEILQTPPFEPAPTPAAPSRAELFGMLYVLEGSRLGAKVLLPSIMKSSDDRVHGATAFLRHGDGQPLWPTFTAILERDITTAKARNAAIAGAITAFEMFEQAQRTLIAPVTLAAE